MTEWITKLATGMLVACAVAVPGWAQTDPPKPTWQISEAVTPLSGAAEVTARLVANQPITNMLGRADEAVLVLRCKERVLAAYVAWPQVLQVSGTSLGGSPQAMVLWKIDSGAIAVNFWTISDSGTATGGFESKSASKIIAKLYSAHSLVVRLTGQTTEDAVFDLGDVAATASKVGSACGLQWTPAK